MPLLPWLLLATLVAGCSDAPRPVKALTPGLHAINQKPLFINSLGMQFVLLPGGRAWVSVWETRVSDYAAFAAATTNGWHAAWFQETINHPAVEVRWDEAEAFCAWLSQRERASGLLGANEGYRLPTSDEWTSSLGQAVHHSQTLPRRSCRPSEEGVIRILRGGGWRDHAPELLASGRQLLVAPHAIAEDYGFRCVLVLKRQPQPE